MEETLNTAPEASNSQSKRKKKPARVSRRVAVFGTVVLVFAIIGVGCYRNRDYESNHRYY